MKARTLSPNEYLFIRWMAENHPALLSAAEQRADRGGLGSLTDSLNAILGGINRGIETYVSGKQAVALVKLNVKRAEQGLPPVTDAGSVYTVSAADMQSRTLPTLSPVALLLLAGLAFYIFARD